MHRYFESEFTETINNTFVVLDSVTFILAEHTVERTAC